MGGVHPFSRRDHLTYLRDSSAVRRPHEEEDSCLILSASRPRELSAESPLFHAIPDYPELRTSVMVEAEKPPWSLSFRTLTTGFSRWALTDSNRRPLPCKGTNRQAREARRHGLLGFSKTPEGARRVQKICT